MFVILKSLLALPADQPTHKAFLFERRRIENDRRGWSREAFCTPCHFALILRCFQSVFLSGTWRLWSH